MSSVWLNGRIVDGGAAVVTVHDRGFRLADGLFETMRAYGGTVFCLNAHMERLHRGARRIGLELPDGLERAVAETLAANGLRSAAVRLVVTRGAGGDGLLPPRPATPTTVVTARPYVPEERWYRSGLRAIIASGRVNEHSATAGLKHLGYGENLMARSEAHDAGCEEALLLNTAGHLAEATVCNIFVRVDRVLLTPAVSCGALPGITRKAVLELGPPLGLEVREEALDPEILAQADEAFLTNSLREIVPLVAVDDVPVGAGRPGTVTLRLLEAYRALVRSETGF